MSKYAPIVGMSFRVAAPALAIVPAELVNRQLIESAKSGRLPNKKPRPERAGRGNTSIQLKQIFIPSRQ